MLAKAVDQLEMQLLTHRFREQARSHIWTETSFQKPVGYQAAALLLLIFGAP
ncbi:hypothetical protein Q1J68_24015 [Pseudomonas pergaminensis]|uniref:hypothetical protein n=1 Tax=Pseudomonas pergaminensis TaxID=2853159 RepID=UPI0034D7286F